ncbi:hypothetical protein [Nocardia sp. NPDC003979]
MNTRTLALAAGVFAAVTAVTCGPATAAPIAGDAVGSTDLSRLVTGLVTTGSGPALSTGSNDTAASTGSSDLAGALLCGLISISDADGIHICNTPPLG